MQTQRLSATAFNKYGTAFSSSESINSALFLHQLELSCDQAIHCYCAEDGWILDYNADMSLLIIHPQSTLQEPLFFYLDRAVKLNAGVQFSVIPLYQHSIVSIYNMDCNAPQPISTRPNDFFFGYSTDMKLGKMYTFFYQECARDFFFRGEQHPPYELVYVDKGSLHNVIDGADYLVEQENLIIIDSNAWHMQSSNESVCFITLSFSLNDSLLPKGVVNHIFHANSQMKQYIKRMIDERDRHDINYHICIESYLQILLVDLSRLAMPDGKAPSAKAALPTTENSGKEVLDRAIGIIENNLYGKISIQQLAKETFSSISYLNKIFNAYVGMSPGKYVTRLRLEEAKSLLREGSMQITEVVLKMNFSSVQHFSKQFKHCFGITPSEYIKMLY